MLTGVSCITVLQHIITFVLTSSAWRRREEAAAAGSLEEQRMLADMAVAAAHGASASQRFAPPNFAAPPFDPGVGARCGFSCASHGMRVVLVALQLQAMPAQLTLG